MKTSMVIIVLALLSWVAPVRADDDGTTDLNKALDLVHQAWNPQGDPLPVAQRTALLDQALKLTQSAPEQARQVRGHRVQAIYDIKSALSLLKTGDPDNQAADKMHSASDELRDALSLIE